MDSSSSSSARKTRRKPAVELKLKVPWGHVAAKAWGEPSSTSRVLMVHGILDNAGSFDRLVALLPANLYYVCVDLPGHGFSSHFQPGLVLSYYNYILAIRYILDELGWDRAFYVGHSMGAGLGLFFTLFYPERIEKLVVIDGIVPRPIEGDELRDKIKQLLDASLEASELKEQRYYTKDEIMYALTYMRNCCLTTDAAKAVFERSVTKVAPDSYYYNRDVRAKCNINPLLSFNQSIHLLRQMKVQTLVILVDDTLPFLKSIKADLCSALACFDFVNIVEVKGNHDVHNNYPERISECISKFLSHVSSKL